MLLKKLLLQLQLTLLSRQLVDAIHAILAPKKAVNWLASFAQAASWLQNFVDDAAASSAVATWVTSKNRIRLPVARQTLTLRHRLKSSDAFF